MLLLPTSTSKLLAQWHGPYEVVRQVGRVNYLVATPERRKKEGVFHINMLRKWKEQASTGYLVMEATDGEEELETLTWDEGEDGEPTFGDQLTKEERRTLAELLRQHQIPSQRSQGVRTSLSIQLTRGTEAQSVFLLTGSHTHTETWYNVSWKR